MVDYYAESDRLLQQKCERKVGRGMGRKSVTENLAAQKCFNPQDAIWQAIRALKARPFSRSELCMQLVNMDMSGINDETVLSYLQRLTRGGYIKAEAIPNSHSGAVTSTQEYTLLRDVGNEAPHLRRDGTPTQQGSGNDKLWRSMKVLKEFTYIDLLASANVGGAEIKTTTAKSYLKHLHTAGYLVIKVPGRPNTPARYQLLPSKNTGPRAPMVQRTHQVFDPNLRQIVWRETP